MGYERNPAVNRVWKVLKIAENIYDENHSATWYDFQQYLFRLCVIYKGQKNTELYDLINGLRLMSMEEPIPHDLIRGVVFHCIDIITKGE